MNSVSLSSSMLYSVNPPKIRPSQANVPQKNHSSSVHVSSSANNPSEKPSKFSLIPQKFNKILTKADPKPIQDAYNYLILRDSGICREKALKFVSNKSLSSRKLPSLTVRSKDKIECRVKQKNKIYKNENFGINVDAINLALKNAIDKRNEKNRKGLFKDGCNRWKDENEKICSKVRIIIKRSNK